MVLDFSPFLSAIIILTVFQVFNILFILNCVKYFLDYSLAILERYFFGVPIMLFIFNFLRYHSSSRQSDIDNWARSLSDKSQKIYNLFVVLYLVVSLILLIWIGNNIRMQNITSCKEVDISVILTHLYFFHYRYPLVAPFPKISYLAPNFNPDPSLELRRHKERPTH